VSIIINAMVRLPFVALCTRYKNEKQNIPKRQNSCKINLENRGNRGKNRKP